MRLKFSNLKIFRPTQLDAAKILIFDGIAIIIAGSWPSRDRNLCPFDPGMGRRKPESNILVFGDAVPSPHAVACNAAMARANDYGAFHEKALVHMNDPLVPGCLAISERLGGISGKEFITALVVGMEVMARSWDLSLNTAFLKTGFQTTNHVGSFGTALAAGRLLKLDPKTLVQALGITYGQIAGTVQATVEGSVMVRIQQGFAAEIGNSLRYHGTKGDQRP